MRTPESDAHQPLVLLVGQGEAAQSELQSALQGAGLAAEFVADGAAAVGAYQRLAPDAVLVDLPLGGMDGPEVCHSLRGMESPAGSAVVVCVEADDPATIERAYCAGAADVIARPAPPSFVAQRLQFVLRAAVLAESNSPTEGDRSTGLADRRQFLEQLSYAISQARSDGSTIAVMCLDLDRFRELVYGIPHDSVDELLATVARRLRRGVRESDVLADLEPGRTTIARVGGGEFSVLIHGLARIEDAAKAGRRLLDVLTEPLPIDGREITVSASIGISSFPGEYQSPEELLGCAQTAAYCAKQQGRDTVQFYQPTMNSRAFERLSLESSLRQALDREEFRVYYQPRVEISSGKLLSFEALVRWQHPELGLVSPGQFIPLAEETGLIVPMGEWVLRTACAQNRAWQDEGLDPVRVSVNLSSLQFQQANLFDTVVRALSETKLDAEWLELELTESLLMENAEAVVATLKRFRDTGIHLSIDDFGTGYSSLSYLKRFPIDALKIDQSFIREVTTNADDAALATSIILMGRSLKLRVVAEGVETESQLSFLRIMQCDEAQGYLYSPPVPAAEAVRFLRDGVSKASAA
jgi:diguanylate cyclase (GGDEF)-like protein